MRFLAWLPTAKIVVLAIFLRFRSLDGLFDRFLLPGFDVPSTAMAGTDQRGSTVDDYSNDSTSVGGYSLLVSCMVKSHLRLTLLACKSVVV